MNYLTKSDPDRNASTTPAMNAAQFKLPMKITCLIIRQPHSLEEFYFVLLALI